MELDLNLEPRLSKTKALREPTHKKEILCCLTKQMELTEIYSIGIVLNNGNNDAKSEYGLHFQS